ncbi:MAG: hypothetical protein JWR05_1373 [Mucilaginibacter sp.]|nr:hypothetical protein [Mucilaginibacter sp.]
MKKYFTYWILLFAFALIAGCKPDPVNYNIPIATTPAVTVKADIKILAGKWNYTSDNVKLYVNDTQSGGQPYTYSKGEYVQFNNDGTGRDYITSFTYTLKDDKLTINYSAYVDAGVPIDAYTDTCTIKELSANKLTLYYDNSYKDINNMLSGSTVMEYLSR